LNDVIKLIIKNKSMSVEKMPGGVKNQEGINKEFVDNNIKPLRELIQRLEGGAVNEDASPLTKEALRNMTSVAIKLHNDLIDSSEVSLKELYGKQITIKKIANVENGIIQNVYKYNGGTFRNGIVENVDNGLRVVNAESGDLRIETPTKQLRKCNDGSYLAISERSIYRVDIDK